MEDANSTLLYTEPQVEQVAKLRKSREMDYPSSGRDRVYLGGFSLNLSGEISRVMLGSCFPSWGFTHMGSWEASGCSTDTRYIGRGLLKNTEWDVLGANDTSLYICSSA